MTGEFAQIVGLLSAFTTGRDVGKQTELTDFLVWLTDHHHKELRASIERSDLTATSIKTLLNRNIDKVSGKLEVISEQIAILLSRSEGLEDLAVAYAKESFSVQAIEILTLMDENEAEYFLLSEELGVKDKRLVLSAGPNYICKETRFLQDDLALLVSLGLLLHGLNSKNKPKYSFTRAASKLIASIK